MVRSASFGEAGDLIHGSTHSLGSLQSIKPCRLTRVPPAFSSLACRQNHAHSNNVTGTWTVDHAGRAWSTSGQFGSSHDASRIRSPLVPTLGPAHLAGATNQGNAPRE